MSKKNTLIIFILFWGFYLGQAQDPIFSQFYASPLIMNPAFTGNTSLPLIHLNYRNQWSSFPTAYSTYAMSYDQYFEKLNTGIGMQVIVDDAGAGIYKTNNYSGFFSYRLMINRSLFLKFGVEAGIIQQSLNWSKLIFYNQIDPINGIDPNLVSGENQPNELSHSRLDISSGLLLYSPKYYFGLSLKHINTPDVSFLNVNNNLAQGWPMRFSLHGGMQITLIERNKRSAGAFISPNVIFVKQGDFSQLNIGAYGGVGLVFAGVWYRHDVTNSDAAIFSLGFKKKWFKIAYSYDLTISKLASQRGGSHELALTLNFDIDKPKKVDYNDCFEIFR